MVDIVPTLGDIPGHVDCALLALPAMRVATAVADCAKRGVAFAIVVASGFGESGASGRADERQLVETANSHGLRILGPNTIGLYSGPARVHLWPRPDFVHGSVALATQSGNVAEELFQLAKVAGIGFSRCIGLGNQADIGFGEVLNYLAEDVETRAVVIYVEGITSGHGLPFAHGLRACAAQGKPVFVLKAGRSVEGAAAARTHTNSLAGDDRVWSAALAELGATRVTSTEDAIDCLQCATKLPRIGRKVVVLADGGGSSVVAVDAIRDHGFELAELSFSARDQLSALIPPSAPRSPSYNPITVDTPGGVEDDPRVVSRCAEAVSRDPGVELLVIVGGLGAYKARATAELETADELARLFRGGLAMAIQTSFLHSGSQTVSRLVDANIPLFPNIHRMVAALATRVGPDDQSPSPKPAISRPPTHRSIVVSSTDAMELLRRYRIKVPQVSIVASVEELVRASGIGFPLCVKVADPSVIHKSDVNGVVLNLEDQGELVDAARRLWQRFPNSRLSVMPSYRPGLELIVGCHTDPTFGPIVLFGRGGIWTEMDNDVAIRLAPISASAALASLGTLRIAPQIAGARGQEALAAAALAEVIAAMSQLSVDNPDVEIELNPLILYATGYEIADVRALRSSRTEVHGMQSEVTENGGTSH